MQSFILYMSLSNAVDPKRVTQNHTDVNPDCIWHNYQVTLLLHGKKKIGL